MKIKETVYIGRNNAIRISLMEDGSDFSTAYPAVTPTRWVLTFDDYEIDSDINPDAFDWDSANSILQISLGDLVNDAADYLAAELTVYAAEWPNGIVWVHPTASPDRLYIRVSEPIYT